MSRLRPGNRSGAYFALIADVVGSREVGDRAGLQRRILGLLEELNGELGSALAAPLALVGGDEMQGLFRDPTALVDVVTGLEEGLHPVRVVVGIGRGGLTTDLLPDVGALDGPAFHRARAALETARSRDEWVRMEGMDPGSDALLTATFSLIAVVRGRWTETQRRYALAARTSRQREVAEHFGVGESTVSESLRASRAAVVQEAERAVATFLVEQGRGETEAPGSP